MEIIGKVKVLCDLIQGETAAGPWCKRDVVVTTIGDDAHDIALTCFGERKVEKLTVVKVGDMVQAFCTVRSKASGERWFTSVDVSSLNVLQKAGVQTEIPAEALPTDEPPF